MSIRVITFDLDDTLWDVRTVLQRAEAAQRDWLAQHRPAAVESMDEDALRALKTRIWKAHPELSHNLSALRRRFIVQLQLDAGYGETDALSGAEGAFDAFFRERQRVDFYPGALAVLGALAPHYRLGALTNGNADVFRTQAAAYFDFAFTAEEVGASKPARALFEAALERTGAAPREVLHVGDHPEHDVQGALDAGLRAVWLNAADVPRQWESAPDATIQCLDELPAAVAALQGPREPTDGR